MKVKRLDKLPKRKVFIDDLFQKTDTDEAIETLIEDKNNLEDLVIFYTTPTNGVYLSNGLSKERMVYLLEHLKFALLSED